MERAIIERIDPADVPRELAEAIARTEALGQAIEITLAEVERELMEIRRLSPALAS